MRNVFMQQFKSINKQEKYALENSLVDGSDQQSYIRLQDHSYELLNAPWQPSFISEPH